jgi:crotonobetainyl-CoA:carnitine CoA-transferase CaiB-like acyl-CoA transferase
MIRSLQGLRVLECGHFIAGPRCAQILADHGAEVVKLEPPGGDLSRRSAPKINGWSLYFAAHNRHKQSVVVDLKRPEAQPVLARLIEWADVIVTNFTPAATARLGLDFASASKVNPRIVVVRISAYGITGSGRDLPGFDGTVQARSGLAHMVGPADRPPTVTSVPLTDYLTAVEGALGAMLGLSRRDLTNQGQEVDVSMMDAANTLLGYLYAEVLVGGKAPMRTGSRAPYALTGAYEAADGFLYIAPIGDAAWAALTGLIGHPEWATPASRYSDPDTRLRDRDIVEGAVNQWTRGFSRDELIGRLDAVGIPCGPVRSVDEVAVDPLLAERAMLEDVVLGSSGDVVPMPGVEIKLTGVEPEHDRAMVPELGMHTDDVLGRLGFDAAEIAALRASGALP